MTLPARPLGDARVAGCGRPPADAEGGCVASGDALERRAVCHAALRSRSPEGRSGFTTTFIGAAAADPLLAGCTLLSASAKRRNASCVAASRCRMPVATSVAVKAVDPVDERPAESSLAADEAAPWYGCVGPSDNLS